MQVYQRVQFKINVLTLINLVSTLNSGIFASTPLLALRTVPGLWFRKGFQFKTVQVKPLIGAIIIITTIHLAMFSSSAITDGYRWPITAASFSSLVCHRVSWAHCPLWGWCWSREPPANKLRQNALKKNSLALETFCSQKSLSGKVLSINRAFSVQMTKSMYSRTGEQRSCNWTYGKLRMTKVTTSWLKTFQFVTVPKTCWVFNTKVLGKKKKPS